MPRKRKGLPAAFHPLSISYDEPTGAFDRKGRPITQPKHVVIETREAALIELERQLRDRDSLSSQLKEWLADAITLRRTDPSTFPTLDRALGLSKGKGSPGTPDAHEELARSIFPLRLQGASWNEIALTLTTTTKIARDARTLQRIYAKYANKLRAEELGRRLDLDSAAEKREAWQRRNELLARLHERRRNDNK
jgi:hypothetical protein